MNKYENVKVLGEGGYGKAILARQKSDGQMCVIKEVRLTALSAKDRNEATKEAKVLASLKHPNIVKYINSFQERGCFYIVMEYCDGGDLSAKIEKRGKKLFSEEEILHYFIQIALAIKYIHDRKILHRDLKAQNIFLTKTGGVKLGDFGISRVLEHTFQLCRTQIGTPYYLSPEICQGRNYNSKTDIWSLGCILYELCTLKHAFQGGNMKGLMMNIVTGKFAPISNTYSKDLHDLVNSMLTKETDKRPSINEILKRPFIQSRLSSLLDKTILDYEFSHTIMHGRKPFAAPTIVIGHKNENDPLESIDSKAKPEPAKPTRPPNPNQSSIKRASDKNRSSSEDRYGNKPVRQQQYNFPSNVDPRYARNNRNYDDLNRKPNNDRAQYQQQQQMLAKQREEQEKEHQRQIQELKRLHREDEQRARDEAERIRKQKEKDAQQQREKQRMEMRKQREIEEFQRAAQEREKQKRRMEQQQKELDEMRRLADQQRKKEEEIRRRQMEEYRKQEEEFRKKREEEKRIMRNHAVEEEKRQAEQLERERLAEVEKKRKEMEEMVRKRQHEAEELKRQQEQKRKERLLEQQREREELEQERIKIAEEERARRKAVFQKQKELREQQKREQEERRNRQRKEIQNAGLQANNDRINVKPQPNVNKNQPHYQQPMKNETFVTAQDYGTPDYDPLDQTSAEDFISRMAVNQPAWVKQAPKRIPVQLDETIVNNEDDQTSLLESCQSKDFFNFLNKNTKETAKSEETLGFTFIDSSQRPAWAKHAAPQVIDPFGEGNAPQSIPPSKSEENVQHRSRLLPDHILQNESVEFSGSDDEEKEDREIDHQIQEKFIEEDANNLSALHDLAMSIQEALDMPDVHDHHEDDDHGNEQVFYVNDQVVKFPVAKDKESLAQRQNAIKSFLEKNVGRETLIALNEELIQRDADEDSPTPIINDLPPGIVCLAQQWLMLDSTSKDDN